MFAHICDAIVITCIDFRIQPFVEQWLNKNFGERNYDHVSLAGGVYDFYTILRQVEISNNLHKVKKVVLINHEDCGAYGAEGSFERHLKDLAEAERKIESLFPHLDVETYFLHLDGTLIETSRTNPRGYKIVPNKQSK